MKIQLETISPDTRSPFRLLHNPRLNDLFYWHFHPEYELVYIEGASATRHVGDHISSYEGSDLVMIGSDIPHLNFDHGVQSDYKKEVLHIKPSFRNEVIGEFPELSRIDELFKRSQYGIVFEGETKTEIGKRLQKLEGMQPFRQFMEIMDIFEILCDSDSYALLHDSPYINRYKKKEQERLRLIYAYIDENYHRKIRIDEVASLSSLGREAFCRYFKKATGSTFTGFLNQYRISQAKRLLLMGHNISEACYDCGFESLSYFNRIFKKIVSENPSEFKRRLLSCP